MKYFLAEYITIPNLIILDKELTITSKYLYGLLNYYTYIGNDTIENKELMEDLDCTEPTFRKALNQLKNKGYISIELINKNQRKITCLVLKSIILEKRKQQKESIEIERLNELNKLSEKIYGKPKETPQVVNEFIAKLKEQAIERKK